MKRSTIITLALVALLMPSLSSAQQDSTRGRMRGGMGMGMGMGMDRAPQLNTIEWLLSRKEQFRPSADQVKQLEAISARLASDFKEDRAKLQKLREEGMSRSGDRREMRDNMRGAMEKMRKQDDKATEDALILMNAEQKKVVKDMLAARRKEMKERRRGMERAPA